MDKFAMWCENDERMFKSCEKFDNFADVSNKMSKHDVKGT